MKPTNINEMKTEVRELTDDELSEVTGGAPSESLTLNFTKVSFSYHSQTD